MEGFHGGLHYSSPFVEMDLERSGRIPNWNLTGRTGAESRAPGIAQNPEEYCSTFGACNRPGALLQGYFLQPLSPASA